MTTVKYVPERFGEDAIPAHAVPREQFTPICQQPDKLVTPTVFRLEHIAYEDHGGASFDFSGGRYFTCHAECVHHTGGRAL